MLCAFSVAHPPDPDPARRPEWLVFNQDLLPLMREALATAWAKGFLSGSRESGDYCIGGMNLGWELPGTFDVELEIWNLIASRFDRRFFLFERLWTPIVPLA